MLKLENITVLFDDLKALDHVNMEFMEGKITGIIGTNGSGKSTLMKVMTKLLKPQEGSVYSRQKERFIFLSTRSQYGVSKSGTTTVLYHCKR